MKTFLYFTASALYVLSFPSADFSWLAWVCLVPTILAIDKENEIRKAILNSFICGWVVFLVSMYWLTYITVVGWIVLTFCLAFYFTAFAIVRFYDKRFIVVPIAWTALEFIRGHFLSGMPWLLLGASQYKLLSLIQISNITGIYGISFVVALINVSIVEILKRKYKGLSAVALILIIVFVYGKYCLNKDIQGDKINVAVVQPNISQEIKWDPDQTEWMYEQLLNLTNKITNTDLIVWPETVLPTVIETPQLFSRIKDLAKEKNANLIFGSQTAKKENSKILYFNSAFLISNKGELTGIYNKIHLVPFGEYVPLVKYFPFLKRLTPIEEGFTPGSEYSIFSLLSSNYKLSTIICFEDIFPGLSRKFVKQGANILVNLTNDAWYDKTCAVYQHAYLSVFRAVENSVPLIRATNTGLSCFIDYRGKIDKITPFVPISEAREVFIPKNSTFYTRFGDVFGWTCVISLLLSIAGGIYVRRTTKRIIST